ncbi:hypothetical protein DFH08DRAFT_827871 [Mycena albidolilacea]|uniref:Uncharacterized protein n=1 Tax=Mycena albidolilacea TaxID=1033008 RepID=A0AAD7E6Y1_9AGAR|nr:hypothetical protein DFH08DRAFT_827871 [Mycena albidolilacea]
MPLIPDGMVAFAVCTTQSVATPPTAKSLASNSLTLDALMLVVLPGNPDSNTYNVHADHLPDEFTSMVYGVGPRCVFNLSTARWTQAPILQTNAVMQFDGLCRDLSPEDILRIKVDSTALNIGSNMSTTSDNQTSTNALSALSSPSKWRKFNPPSPPSGPESLSSSSSSLETMPYTPATQSNTLATTVANTAATSTPSGSSVSGTEASTG